MPRHTRSKFPPSFAKSPLQFTESCGHIRVRTCAAPTDPQWFRLRGRRCRWRKHFLRVIRICEPVALGFVGIDCAGARATARSHRRQLGEGPHADSLRALGNKALQQELLGTYDWLGEMGQSACEGSDGVPGILRKHLPRQHLELTHDI